MVPRAGAALDWPLRVNCFRMGVVTSNLWGWIACTLFVGSPCVLELGAQAKSCAFREWSKPEVYPRQAPLRFPSLAIGENKEIVVGNSISSFLDTLRPPLLGGVVNRIHTLERPPGSYAFAIPKVTIGTDRVVDLLWVEEEHVAAHIWPVTPTRVMHASMTDKGWSAATEILRARRVLWGVGQRASVLRDSTGVLHVAFAAVDDSGTTIVYARRRQGWIVQKYRVYSAVQGGVGLLIGRDGNPLIAFAIIERGKGLLRVVRGRQSGQWNVVLEEQLRAPPIELTMTGDIGSVPMVLWTDGEQPGRPASSIRQLRVDSAASRDSARSIHQADVLSALRAVTDRCGGVHLIVQHGQATSGPHLDYLRSEGHEQWSRPQHLWGAQGAIDPELASTTDSLVLVFSVPTRLDHMRLVRSATTLASRTRKKDR